MLLRSGRTARAGQPRIEVAHKRGVAGSSPAFGTPSSSERARVSAAATQPSGGRARAEQRELSCHGDGASARSVRSEEILNS